MRFYINTQCSATGVDVCLIMVLVVVCVWLSKCVMTLCEGVYGCAGCVALAWRVGSICWLGQQGAKLCRCVFNGWTVGVYVTVILCSASRWESQLWFVLDSTWSTCCCFIIFFPFHIQALSDGICQHGSLHCHLFCVSLPDFSLLASSPVMPFIRPSSYLLSFVLLLLSLTLSISLLLFFLLFLPL